jgi:Flp pilus assembly protein TadD
VTNPSARRTWVVGAAIFAASLLLYARTGGFPFLHFDDNRYVTENPMVRSGLTWAGVAWAFTTFEVSNWHPLTWLSHMLDVELFGMAPGPHHLVNAFLHATNAVLVFLLFLRMTRAAGRSALVALLFAVHPAHVESVAWVAERKDLLSSLLGFLALLAYVAYAHKGGWLRYLAVLVLFASSLLAKPMWVTLPFVLLLLDVWPLRRLSGSLVPDDPTVPPAPRVPAGLLVAEKLPLLALSAASSAVTFVAQASGGAVAGSDLGLGSRLGNAALSYVRYALMLAWPSDLAVHYPHPGRELSTWLVLVAVAALLVASSVAVACVRRAPWLFVGWFWFLGTLVPVIGLVQVGAQAMADRYTYFPSIGLFVVATWGGAALANRVHLGRFARAAAGAAVLVLAVAAWRQVGFWTGHEVLFRRALAVQPRSAYAVGLLSDGLRRAGRIDEALALAEEAVRLSPTSVRHGNNLAMAYRDARRLPEARDELGRIATLDPTYVATWANLGLVELELGRDQEAVAAYQRAATLGTRLPSVWTNLGVLHDRAGRGADALACFEMASVLDPANPSSWFNLGLHQLRHGRPREAERALAQASRLDPDNRVFERTLAEARAAAIGR